MKTAHNGAVDWFYKFWVLPVAAITWFGIALILCFVFLPLGILALIFAAILFEGLLSYRASEQASTRRHDQATQ